MMVNCRSAIKTYKMAVVAAIVVLSECMMWQSCSSIDDDRIPPYAVYLPFATQADWITYGVAASLDHRNYVKSLREPASYPWTAMSMTGFGGLLLCVDYMGNPVAYDLACPVECRQDVRIRVDEQTHEAYCPVCGSRYDIYGTYGYPLSGVAHERHYGLQVYRVAENVSGQYRLVTR